MALLFSENLSQKELGRVFLGPSVVDIREQMRQERLTTYVFPISCAALYGCKICDS